MKNQLLLCFFCAVYCPMWAQLGITVSPTKSQVNEWQVVPENFIVHRRADFLRYGTRGVIDYAFTLKNKAVRLRPALHLMYAKSVYPVYINTAYYSHYFHIGVVGVEGNIEFALWKAVDRNGKEPPFRPFFQLSPGLALVNLRYQRPVDDDNGVFESFTSHRLATNFGANLFLEFKLTKLLTIAPTAGLRIFPNLTWKDFTEIVTEGTMIGIYDRTNLEQFNIGLRVGLSFL